MVFPLPRVALREVGRLLFAWGYEFLSSYEKGIGIPQAAEGK